MTNDNQLLKTPLHALHVELGARLVAFAGYDMPVQYPAGILAEHAHTRAAAGLFDVSHMGQVRITGANAAKALEALVPGDIAGLQPGQMRYALLTNEVGGIIDDLMVTNLGGEFRLVVNAACKVADVAHLRSGLPDDCALEVLEDRALLALQGPGAADVLVRHGAAVDDLVFMTAAECEIGGTDCLVSRSGYTGEDGFEISVGVDEAEACARLLLSEREVEPIGLGARDSLRLEAGLCLYGHDIDGTTTPVEATLAWTIAKRRRAEGGFPGADIILGQLAGGTAKKRVGFLVEGPAPAREGAEVMTVDGTAIGQVTSGGFGPTVGAPVAMGYVDRDSSGLGTRVDLMVRGRARPAEIAKMPFVAHKCVKDK